MRCLVVALVALLFTACDQPTSHDFRPIDASAGPGASSEVYEDATTGARREVFYMGGGEQTPLADYLFVVDNSSSMKRILDRFTKGFATLARDREAFPAKARIGVMSTMPRHPKQAHKLHPGVGGGPDVLFDPGFQQLVSKQSIERFHASPDKRAGRFNQPGCSAWFSPGERNENRVPCILAHTQTLLASVGIEAGLTAFGQRLAGKPLFRPGAAVNVIFVSDTHDPGISEHHRRFEQLVEGRPDFASLEQALAATHAYASFKVHAIAPRSECSELWAHIGTPYFDVADASGGESSDICQDHDYSTLIRSIVDNGSQVTRPVFPLSTQATAVQEVIVDGVPSRFSTVDGGAVLVLEEAVPSEAAQVEVIYSTGRPDVGRVRARNVGPRSAQQR